MKFEEAKATLAEAYAGLGMQVRDDGRALHLTLDRTQLAVTEEDIETFACLYPQFAALAVAPCDCGICSADYREQIVVPIDPASFIPLGIRYRDPFVFGKRGDGTFVEVGPASDLFKYRLRFHDPFVEQWMGRIRQPYRHSTFVDEDEGQIVNVLRTMPNLLTIRVHNLGQLTVEHAIKASSPIIEACLFELSYLKDEALALSEDWPARQPRLRPFRHRDPLPGNDLPLPSASFNSDIVRFYQRGVSTRDPVIQFLSFYHVLEYHFINVSDERLHSTLAARLNDPAFSPTLMSLDRLVRDVLDHKRVTDETEMLRLVLEKFVPFPDLADFISAFEAHKGEKIYTRRRQIFGQEVPEAKLQEGHLFPNLAKRVKVVRNAIVHSADRYEGHERYIPLTPKSEATIRDEIPMLRFLAEKVIVATAQA